MGWSPVVSTALIDDALRSAVREGLAPGVVGALTDRRDVLYQEAFGYAGSTRREALRIDSVFRIASLTKLVTTVGVLMLADQRRIDLDAPFKRYVSDYRQPPVLRRFERGSSRFLATPSARDVTIRELLTHTSGYGSWFLNEEIVALTGAAPEYYNPPFLMYEPGARFQYGVSTDVLGQLFVPTTGLSLAEFFAERIFRPLGMRETSYDLPRDSSQLASVHVATPSGFEEVPTELGAAAPRGGSGLYSTAADLLRLLRLLLNGGSADGVRLLEPDTVAALATNQVGSLPVARQRTALPEVSCDFLFMDGSQKFGFGVLIESRATARGRSAGSYGWAGLYNTYFWIDPAAGLGAVLLMQMSPFSAPPCLEVCARFERAAFGAFRPVTRSPS